jgi:cardiolipin synthase A/B
MKTYLNPFYYLTFIFLLCSSLCFAEEQLIIEPDMGRSPIISLLKNAKSSIKLVMYGLTDSQMIEALTTAKTNGKNVQILLEYHPYKSQGENDGAFQQLQKAAIDIAKPNPNFQLIHQKTLLIDQNQILIMTFNFTHSSFKNERNFALLLTDPTEIQEIQRVFAADWQQKRAPVNDPHLVWSPDNSREKILNFIKTAHSNLKLYAQGLTDYQTIGTLAKVARAGIKVQILLSSKPLRHNKKLAYLIRAGANVRISKNYTIHAKVILIDNERALLGSINFTQPSMDHNRELSVITQSTNVVNALNKTFDEDWQENEIF